MIQLLMTGGQWVVPQTGIEISLDIGDSHNIAIENIVELFLARPCLEALDLIVDQHSCSPDGHYEAYISPRFVLIYLHDPDRIAPKDL